MAPRLGSKYVGGSIFTNIPYDDAESIHTVHAREAERVKSGRKPATIPSQVKMVEVPTHNWQSAVSWEPDDNTEFALDPVDGTMFQTALHSKVVESPDEPVPKTKKKKKPRSQASKRPHVYWRDNFRAIYLDEFARGYGRGDFGHTTTCGDCLSRKVEIPGAAVYRCSSECVLQDLVCQDCCVRRHRKLPLHRIQKWTGTHFDFVSLKSLGLRIQLNHTSMSCLSPSPSHMFMTVLHVNGLHEVAFDFCDCEKKEPHNVQLLRRRFFPATQLVVRTCASFELLELLHKLSLTTKSSMYDLYRGLEKLTDCSGLRTPKSKYRALMRMCLQYRHLKMLLWGGRAHDPSGPAGTQPGELALRCPSCPWPGINLPVGWEKALPEERFLYTLFACMDANFRLKNQKVSNYSQDPGLGMGMAFMLPREEYEEYQKVHAKEGDISTCVGFQAIAQANTKFSMGLRYTGVGGVFCGRSEMVLPSGIGNLTKGERYSNMDFIFASGMKVYHMLAWILISYDIACQWFLNLHKRMKNDWPKSIKLPKKIHLIPAIPKLHEPAHEGINHEQYSLNLIPGVGLSDMETPERVWGPHNAIGVFTQTQGPGSRSDIIDDHLNFWNWLKIINMGATLLRRYRAAVGERNIQIEAHRGLTASVGPALSQKWEKMCNNWEADQFPKSVENPYEIVGTDITEAEVRHQLAKAEEERLRKGGIGVHATSADAFITMALEIQEYQRKIKRLAKGQSTRVTITQDTSLTEQRNQLRIRIQTWELLLPIYMPGLLQHQSDLAKLTGPPVEPENPEDSLLWLPSRLPSTVRDRICVDGLPEIEEKLRTGQCSDALKALRRVLRLKSRMYQWKHKNARGQKEGTRSRVIIQRVHEKAGVAVAKYRVARLAKLALTGPGKWEDTYRVLADEDIRTYRDPNKKKTKGRNGTLEDGEMAVGGSEDVEAGDDPAEKEGDGAVRPDEPESNSNSDVVIVEGDQQKKKKGTGETRRTLSWIWLLPDSNPEAIAETDGMLRSEWAKSRARSTRAAEEVKLLKEEMRRVIAYLKWKRRWWLSRIGLRKTSRALTEGLAAIAMGQSQLQDSLGTKFRKMWELPLGKITPDTLHDEELEAEEALLNPDAEDSEGEENGDEGQGDEGDKEGEGDEDEDDNEKWEENKRSGWESDSSGSDESDSDEDSATAMAVDI